MAIRKAIVLVRPKMGHQPHWGGAFVEGLKRHGWHAEIKTDYERADLVVFWGVRRVQDLRAAKLDKAEICVLERGYIGDRFKFTSVSFGGGLNGLARFSRHAIDDARIRKHFPNILKPWKTGATDRALILGQVETDMSMSGLNPESLYQDMARECRALGYDVRFRPHPGGQSKCAGVPAIGGDLAAALAWADLAITINSNSGVDAVVAGVPCVALDRRSMAWNVSTRHPRQVERPDRARWLQELSYSQWNVEEMASGECWEHARHEALHSSGR